MAKVAAVAGLGFGDDVAVVTPPSPRAMLAWGVVLGATIGIFVGTLMLNPGRKKA